MSNRSSADEVTKPNAFPDINPSNRDPELFQFEVAQGDFLQVIEDYEDNFLDAIVTTFFIDSAQNALTYLDVISRLLKPNGLWINFGGLNFAYEPFTEDGFIPMSLEIFKNIVKKEYDFEFLKDEMVLSSYARPRISMTEIQQNCAFFVCRKK